MVLFSSGANWFVPSLLLMELEEEESVSSSPSQEVFSHSFFCVGTQPSFGTEDWIPRILGLFSLLCRLSGILNTHDPY